MNFSRHRAFTLIELLVVIALIAVLAGIAFPVYAKMLERGHVTQDASNLRQLGGATAAYLNDNNRTLFSKTTTVASTAQGNAGTQLYAPGLLQVNYLPNLQTFHSPFDLRPAVTNPGSSANGDPISYGVNINLLNRGNSAFQGNFSMLTTESQLILYAPTYTGDPTLLASWQGVDTGPATVQTGGSGMTKGPQEDGKWINVLYADFHVANIKYTIFQTTSNTLTSNPNGINGLTQWYPLGTPGGP